MTMLEVKKERKGLACHQCGCRKFSVLYTRSAAEGKVVRRRQCSACGKRFTTWEKRIGQ